MGATQGKIWQVKLGDKSIRCQTDATFTGTVNTSEVEACKPTGDLGDDTTWLDYTEDSRGWEITFSAQAFADTAEVSQADLMELFVNGSVQVEVDFYTNEKVKGFDGTETQYFNGTGLMTNFSLTGGVTGVATYDVTIQGKGKPSWTRTPIVPGP